MNNKLGLAEPVRKVKYFFFSYKSWHPFQNMSVPIFVVCVMFRKLVCVTGSCLKCKMSGALCEYACSRPLVSVFSVVQYVICTLYSKCSLSYIHFLSISTYIVLCPLCLVTRLYSILAHVNCAILSLCLHCLVCVV